MAKKNKRGRKGRERKREGEKERGGEKDRGEEGGEAVIRRGRRGEAQVVEMRGLAKCFCQADKVQAMSGGARPGEGECPGWPRSGTVNQVFVFTEHPLDVSAWVENPKPEIRQ